jgi:hypothetical protein
MSKYLNLILATIITGVSMPALASNFKCVSKSVNPEVVRYEVEVSFDPISFRVDEFFKEDDGSWSLDSETLADSAGVLKPLKILWNSCQTQLISDTKKISYEWSKGSLAAGHLTMNLNSGSGEYYSSFEWGGTVSRRVQFSECVEIGSR